MKRTAEQLLIDAEAAGRALTADERADLHAVSSELVQLGSGPMAPLAAAAIAAAVADEPDGPWAEIATLFARALANQRSVLALRDAVDVLLSDGPVANLSAPVLHEVLIQGIDTALSDAPVLAAVRLESALRLALAGVGTPFLVLDRLTRSIQGLPDSYVEVLPRLVGIALDAWSADGSLADPLLATLEALQGHDAAYPDAAFEVACQQMRRTLRLSDPTEAVEGLRTAADLFAHAADIEEARDDAAAYTAICRAVVAFANQERDAVVAAADSLDAVMATRDAWLFNTHQPDWRSAARDAEKQWLALVLDLRVASERLAEASWLDTAAAVGQIALVYDAERSVRPAPGLVATIRPVVENAVASNAVLLDQLARAVEVDRRRDVPVLSPSADVILAAIRERHSRPRSSGDDEEVDPRGSDRVSNLAPSLRILGAPICRILSNLDDDTLAKADAVVSGLVALRGRSHPTLTLMRDSIIAVLEENPRFRGEVRAAVSVLLERTLTFMLDRYDRGGPLMPGGPNILRRLADDEPPKEAELQWEFYVWLAGPWEFAGRVHCERSDVATGRVDVTVRFGEIELVTEIKRELTDSTPEALEYAYVPQAAQYSGSNEPFSQLLVLDLTDHSGGVRPLEDLAWAVERRVDPGASPQHVVVGIIVGNRPTPSELTRKSRSASKSLTQAARSKPR